MGTTGAAAAPARPRATDEDHPPEALGRDAGPLTRAERRAEAAMGVAFLAAATATAVTLPVAPVPGALVLAMAIVVMALASTVRLAVPGGHAVPIMLASVPVVFLVPPGLFPLVTAAALLLGALPAILRRRASPDRLLLALPNAWFAMGPAIVLGVWGTFPAHEPHLAVLAAALVAQIAVDVVATAVRERLLAGPVLREQLRESLWVHVVDVALAPVGYAVAMAVEHRDWALVLVLPMLWLLHRLAAERRERMERLAELGGAYRGAAMVLGDAIPAGEADAGGRGGGVLALALEVADTLGLDDEQRRRVEFGALLRDIGVVAVPGGAAGTLGPEAFELVATRTAEGRRVLDTLGGLTGDIGRVVRAHHERWDGTGSPDGLAGDAIPVEARIVAACDAWHAITGGRDHEEAMPPGGALTELRAEAGTRLDPVIASVVARLVTAPARGGAPAPG